MYYVCKIQNTYKELKPLIFGNIRSSQPTIFEEKKLT